MVVDDEPSIVTLADRVLQACGHEVTCVDSGAAALECLRGATFDLALVDYFCDRVVVMYLGNVVEILPAAKVSIAPRHPYTKALSDSVFVADPKARKDTAAIEGEVSSPFNLPPGCVFESRCPRARKRCREMQPPLTEVHKGEYVACYFPLTEPSEN